MQGCGASPNQARNDRATACPRSSKVNSAGQTCDPGFPQIDPGDKQTKDRSDHCQNDAPAIEHLEFGGDLPLLRNELLLTGAQMDVILFVVGDKFSIERESQNGYREEGPKSD